MQWLRETAPRRFFAGLEDAATIETLRQRMPDECSDLIASATDIVVGKRFDLLGYQGLSFGDPIDWHLDPVWTRQSPRVHWSQINTLDPTVVGDSKVVWEINRHQWVVKLAQAWALTGDERYAQAAIGAIDAWLDANPPGIGINWASSLEVSYRLISWSWTLLLLRNAAVADGRVGDESAGGDLRSTPRMSGATSRTTSRRTRISPARRSACSTRACCFASSRTRRGGASSAPAFSSRKAGGRLRADGVHFEQSTCYHRYTVEIYLPFPAARGPQRRERAVDGLRDRPSHARLPVDRAAAGRIDSGDRRRGRRDAAAARAPRALRQPRRVRDRGGDVRSIVAGVGGGGSGAGSALAPRTTRTPRVRRGARRRRRLGPPRASSRPAATP